MQDALNYLQYSLNGLQPVIELFIVLGASLSLATGLINLYRGHY